MKNYRLMILFAAAVCLMFAAGCAKKQSDSESAAPRAEESAKAGEDSALQDREGDNVDLPISSEKMPAGTVLGLKLRPTDDIKAIEMKGTVYGTYSIRKMYDGMVVFAIERLAQAEPGADHAKSAIMALENDRDVQDIAVEESKDLVGIDAPAYKATYRVGHNEDTRECRDYYIRGEKFDYRFHTEIPADFVDEYAGMVDDWVQKLEFVQVDAQ